jgi:hypothetical protein
MLMTIPQFEIEFTKRGEIFDQQQIVELLGSLAQFTDLFVLSHGWNNSVAEARELYKELLSNVSDICDAGIVPGVHGRTFAAISVLWPSKKFEEKELIPGGGAASATAENDSALIAALEELKRDSLRLGGIDIDRTREKKLTQAQELVARLEHDEGARREYVSILRSILNPADVDAEDGSDEFFTGDPEKLFDQLGDAVMAPAGPGPDGATSLAGHGSATGLGDLLTGVKAAARRIANFATYYMMKERAGIVGRLGLAKVIQRVRGRSPDVRLHLVGHSFGGRLVTAAAHAMSPNTLAVTMTLLQAAYSHNGLAKNYDGRGHNGSFREILSEQRISGPILITHTKNDRAVGVAYPLASRIAREAAAAIGDENDPYGGMGRNGAQSTPEAKGLAGQMLDVGREYRFSPGKVFNLRADKFIHDHGDVKGTRIAYAMLNGVAAV